MSIEKRPGFSPFFYKLTQIVLLALYRLFFNFKIYGAENVPADHRGVILAPNHASYIDPPILGISLKRPITYLAKEYLFEKPVLCTLICWLGSIPIKTETNDFRTIRQVLKALKEGKQVLLFPEGTRTLDGKFQEPEGGVGFLALKSGAVVVPVYISGTFEAYPKGAKWFRCRPVRVYFGKPFVPAMDKDLAGHENPYLAVGQRIMSEIKKIKEAVQ
ncbi:MAG: lysophospholipid acyltransferase family protein [Candidatus Omnitrophota bacterium]